MGSDTPILFLAGMTRFVLHFVLKQKKSRTYIKFYCFIKFYYKL